MSGAGISGEGTGRRSLLLIDDDSELCALMKDYFSEQGFDVELAHDGRSGLARALEGRHDLILLDVMMPVLDGFEVLAQLRRRSATPVIMLTARTSQEDRIAGLDAGADDYLPKPFGPDELLARIRAVLRRTAPAPVVGNPLVEAGPLRLNSMTREARVEGERVNLTGIEFEILDFLVRNAGRVVSRDELSAVLYQRESSPFDRSLDVHVSHLRRKIEGERGKLIRTVRGVGYMFAVGEQDVT
jgi:two-component system, OmpR family, response regulator CpxR